MKRILLGLIGFFVGTTTIDPGMLSQQLNKEVEVLNQWNGKWKSTATISFGRDPRKFNLTSTTTTNWIVNGHFQQSTTLDQKNEESRRFDHYNKHSRTFHRSEEKDFLAVYCGVLWHSWCLVKSFGKQEFSVHSN